MKIVCLGSGNVATHFAQALKLAGADLIQVWSKTLANAEALANVLGSIATDDLSAINPHADLYLICVKDDAITDVTKHLSAVKGTVIHTSGATPLSVLSTSGFNDYGVIYPLQTFSKKQAVDFKKVPLCIEADNETTLLALKNLASGLSEEVHEISSEDRKLLHLAAVYACNFTNHLYHLAATLLKRNDLSFSLLKPLIMQTAEKVQGEALPISLQTGPAIRNDELTMQRHLELISDFPVLTEVYETLSKSIKKTYL